MVSATASTCCLLPGNESVIFCMFYRSMPARDDAADA
jgi:hypothetical protein